MDAEEPISPDEFVLRRVHRNNTDPTGESLVKRCEFAPGKGDIDGLSLYRERYTSIEALVAAARSPQDVYVARFRVQELLDIRYGIGEALDHRITVEITPGPLPGHVSIPELAYERAKADKPASLEIQRILALLASDRIVHRPPDAG